MYVKTKVLQHLLTTTLKIITIYYLYIEHLIQSLKNSVNKVIFLNNKLFTIHTIKVI